MYVYIDLVCLRSCTKKYVHAYVFARVRRCVCGGGGALVIQKSKIYDLVTCSL